jgi:dynein heavy chain
MILTNSLRWNLLIDPQLQGLKWLKEQFKGNLLVLKYTDKGWKNSFMNGIEAGKVIIFENLEEAIDPTLLPVVGRNYLKRGNQTVVKIGDRELNLNPEFKFFMQTKLSSPH